MKTDVIIIGAGASGLMSALEAGRRGRSVLILDHTPKIGSKIRVSGGGRCNFTNRQVSRENYLSQNPHFVTSALARFRPEHFMAMLHEHGIPYHERSAGQLFCDESAQAVVDMLVAECQRVSVRFVMECRISEVRKNGLFVVDTSQGTFHGESLVVATGGLSYPQLGATPLGYSIARQFGMKVTPLHPALTPLKFSPGDLEVFGPLSGIAVNATVAYKGLSFRENVLFTHRGLSGPAILQVSSYWERGSSFTLDLLPGLDAHAFLLEKRGSRMHLATLLGQHLPARLVKAWCEGHFQSRPLNQYSPGELQAIARSLHGWEIEPMDREGFNKAEVTLGGVDTRGISSQRMESTSVPGLYFPGEVLDVTGQLGGYNLHWAWASGFAAGQYV